MKLPTLICCALALVLAGSADAKTTKTKRAKPMQHGQQAAPPKDPYANYWKDPGRAAPPFSYFGAGNW